MLDMDLAVVYGVTTKRLNEQVRRNMRRFPEDFMFQLDAMEALNLRSHFATSSPAWGGRRNSPFAFTEYGAVMVSSILNTPVAIEASILIARAFVRLRELALAHREVLRRLDALEGKTAGHDRQLLRLLEDFRRLLEPPEQGAKKIGFRP